MPGDSVKVAVRVRPFNQREKNANSKCIISMNGSATTISNPQNGETKTFAFDHSYWSHDDFKEDDSGVFVPQSAKYADQRSVFNDLGQGVLDNAWQGYNAALFAYGQTGSGKSYSMIGYGPNKGIVPITCGELFNAINKNDDKTKQLQVSFSMLEIYNEQVRDLLAFAKEQQKGGLKVRQNPKLGFYVDGLKQVPVQSYTDIEKLMDKGTVNRTTASTNMNATSSRSHMVITIRFKQMFVNDLGENTTKSSEINLVDLAGSERADSTGATGDRLKEGSAINQSLSMLGNVISALADQAMGKTNVQVPYRNSVLTKLLKSALGGNSKTVMIAALSPAAINYDETLSTLRYADRAKKIQNKAVINESPTDKLIRELKEENARLMAELKKQGGSGKSSPVVKDREVELHKLLEENEKEMQNLQLSWEQRLEEAKKEWEKSHNNLLVQDDESWQRYPYLTNINEDPHLSGVVKYAIHEGEFIVGRPGADRVKLELRGLGIQHHHATLCNTENQNVAIQPSVKKAKILVNGVHVTKPVVLKHLDRVVLGTNSLFLFIGFPSERKQDGNVVDKYDFEYFQTEIAEESGFQSSSLMTPRDQSEDVSATLLVFHEYISLLPKIEEANAMSQEMKRGVKFEPKVKNLASHDECGRDLPKEVIVKVTNQNTKQVWVWSKAKFINRKFLIEDLYTKWSEGEYTDLQQSEDPFWDPVEDVFLARCHIWLQSLAYCIEIDDQLDMMDYSGKEEAMVHTKIVPCDSKGKLLADDSLILNPSDLLGKRLDFVFMIDHCMGVKWVREDNKRGVYCSFKFYGHEDPLCSKTVYSSTNPKIDFKKHFTIKKVTEDFLNYLQTHAIVVELWGTQVDSSVKSVSNKNSSHQHKSDKKLDSEVSALKEQLQTQEDEYAVLQTTAHKLKKENFKLKQQVEKYKNAAEVSKAKLKALADNRMQMRDVENGLKNDRIEALSIGADKFGGSKDSINSSSSEGGSGTSPKGGNLDIEMAKGVKIFFKDVRVVQKKLQALKQQAAGSENAKTDQLQSVLETQLNGIVETETHLNSCVAALKETMAAMIKRKKQNSIEQS